MGPNYDDIARRLLASLGHDSEHFDYYGLMDDPDEFDEALALVVKVLKETCEQPPQKTIDYQGGYDTPYTG